MNKIVALTVLISLSLCGCTDNRKNDNVVLITREEGSGTRTAFAENLNITDENGVDLISDFAEVTNSTAVMLQSVCDNPNAVGYVSLSSLSDSVKAISADGEEITEKNVKNGMYKISRRLVICRRHDDANILNEDFISFVQSEEGQKIVDSCGFISVETHGKYISKNPFGKLVLVGSTSAAPVTEALCEEYKRVNPNVEFEIQQTGSTAGISAAADGICDMALSSRALTDNEKILLSETDMALDAIAVIVNKKNKTDNLSVDDIRKLFEGKITKWSELR